MLEDVLADDASLGDFISPNNFESHRFKHRPYHMFEHHIGMSPLFRSVISDGRYAQPKLFRAYLRQLWRRQWVVYAKKPFRGSGHVLQYLARYTHHVAISNHRLIAFDNDMGHIPVERLRTRQQEAEDDAQCG